MCEMYDYDFIKGKSYLPKTAVYISYLSQLLLNTKCSVKMKNMKMDSGDVDGDVSQILEAIGNPIKIETEFDK